MRSCSGSTYYSTLPVGLNRHQQQSSHSMSPMPGWGTLASKLGQGRGQVTRLARVRQAARKNVIKIRKECLYEID